MFLGIGWSTGSALTYLLSLYFHAYEAPSELVRFFEGNPLVTNTEDLAGMLGYLSCFLVCLILAVRQGTLQAGTWRMSWPEGRRILRAFFRSVLIMGPAWVGVSLWMELYRYRLPGDGNWVAIASLTGLGSYQLWLFRRQMTCVPTPV